MNFCPVTQDSQSEATVKQAVHSEQTEEKKREGLTAGPQSHPHCHRTGRGRVELLQDTNQLFEQTGSDVTAVLMTS